MKIRKNDTIVVIAGKEKGAKGKVRKVLPEENKVVVEGVNLIKRHSKTQRTARQGGIIELEAPFHCSNVMLLCDKCGKPVRVGCRFLDDGRKVRICRSCNEVID